MDELKVSLRTKFMRDMVAKLLSKLIKDKTGVAIDLRFVDLNAEMVNGRTCLKANIEADLENDEFKNIAKKWF